MLGLKQRYFLASLARIATGQGKRCPSCGASESAVVSRKYGVTALRRCSSCRLLYRSPTSSAGESHRYYNVAYRSGLTTDTPDETTLRKLKRDGFAGTGKCFGRYAAILRALGLRQGARILDYGCSWGYGAWQLQQAGFSVVGFDVSKARVAFARDQLGIDAVADRNAVQGQFDAVFSAHVLEHVPSVAETIDWALDRLRSSGLLVAVTPNGSAEFRARHPERWNRMWGYVHPNFLDAEYYANKFAEISFLVTSRLHDFEEISAWAGSGSQRRGDLGGWELLVVCAK